MSHILYTSLVIILAFGGQALFGFGGGLVAVPLLSLLLNVGDAVVLVAIFQFLFGALAIRNYRSVAWSLMPSLLVGMLLGLLVGVWALPLLPERFLQGLLSVTIIAFLIEAALAPRLGAVRPSSLGGMCAGAASGFFQGCLGMGGPPVVMYLKKIISDTVVFRASMIFCLSVANAVRIPLVGYNELFTVEIGIRFLQALPAFLVAAWLGQRYHDRVPAKLYFRVVCALLGVTAVILLVKAVLVNAL